MKVKGIRPIHISSAARNLISLSPQPRCHSERSEET